MATINDIADAVVYELTQNSASFVTPIATVSRDYHPQLALTDVANLRVVVVPQSMVMAFADRGHWSFDYTIDIAVMKKTDMSQASLDTLMSFVEEVADYFRKNQLTHYPDARLVGIENKPVYALDHLDEFRQFTSVLSLTYRVWR